MLVERLRDYFDYLLSTDELSGYPKTNPLSIRWSPGQGAGHRIPIKDMPPRVAVFDRTLRKLKRQQQMSLFIKYGLDRNAKGVPITNAEKAEMLNLTLPQFHYRVKSAKKALLKKLPKHWA
tara:strand:- start:920 stop:1282 length:363 start_codon:yes stop_codon:yes gene_type:complete